MLASGALFRRTGRRRFFLVFGAVAIIAAPLSFTWALSSAGAGTVFAVTLVQLVTVSAYGPVPVTAVAVVLAVAAGLLMLGALLGPEPDRSAPLA